jgi:hypothetical protein
MKLSLPLYICCLIVACLCFHPARNTTLEARSLGPTSLCTKDEKVVFSCPSQAIDEDRFSLLVRKVN